LDEGEPEVAAVDGGAASNVAPSEAVGEIAPKAVGAVQQPEDLGESADPQSSSDATPNANTTEPLSPRSPVQKGDVLTVKLSFPDGQMRRIAYRKRAAVAKARDEAAKELGVPRERIILVFAGDELDDATLLTDLQIPSTGQIIVNVLG
jgi:hypothetical protein